MKLANFTTGVIIEDFQFEYELMTCHLRLYTIEYFH